MSRPFREAGASNNDRCIWGKTCFAEFCEEPAEGNHPWTVQKYGSDWSFYLSNEANAAELVRRLDEYEERQQLAHPLERGI